MLNVVAIKEFMSIKTVVAAISLVSMSIILTGCMAARLPVDMKYVEGAVVDSLSSNVSLAYKNRDRSISGSGFLMYRKPDQMRATILSPFGSVLQEIYKSGDLITIIDTGNGIAFSGTDSDLPDKGDFSGWRYINWLIDIDSFSPSQSNAVIERINRFGQTEKAAFENGLLISKTTVEGGQVRYDRYTAVKGVPLPLEISYETVAKEKFTIILDDPEINISFKDDVFIPNLSKLRVYPLSRLK